MLSSDHAGQVWQRLRPPDQQLLRRLVALTPAPLYLVGGGVRDALLGQTPLDLDIVLEANDAVEALAQASGLPFVYHPAFQNATLSLSDGRTVDVVRSRGETYPVLGDNPHPFFDTIEADLRRRDFTLNSLALRLDVPRLLDPLGGGADLQERLLRPNKADSFAEDASRLVRGARLAARLGLQASPELLAQVPQALAMAQQTPRLWAELRLLLGEIFPGGAARQLAHWGAGGLVGQVEALERLDHLRRAGKPISLQVYAAVFLAGQSDAPAMAERLGLGLGALALLRRAHSGEYYAPSSDEMRLRDVLGIGGYTPLTGRDILALGVAPGPQVGQILAQLAQRRAQGQLASAEAERHLAAELVTQMKAK